MGTITVKFAGKCKTCGKAIAVGQQASYEKGKGIFCDDLCQSGLAPADAPPPAPRASNPAGQVEQIERLIHATLDRLYEEIKAVKAQIDTPK